MLKEEQLTGKKEPEMVWDMTAPPPTKQVPQPGFKGFSEKHR
jgi:hypothetical protein